MGKILQSAVLTLMIIIGSSFVTFADEGHGNMQDWMNVVAQIQSNLSKALSSYKNHSPDEAKSYITEAYFGVFEEKKMEHAIETNISSKRAHEVEALFGDIRKAINRKEAPSEVIAIIKELSKALEHDAMELDKMGAK